MSQRRPTSISDIARAAGVSHPTVSRALNDSPLISAGVRQRIQRLAKNMDYTPNALAQGLRATRSHTIGLVMTSIADPYFSDVVRGIEEVARPAHFSLFLSAAHNDPAQQMAAIETLRRRRVDGVLMASTQLSTQIEEYLAHLGIPTVLVNNETDSESALTNWVVVDDIEGARLATEHLQQLGHNKIGYIGVNNRPRSNRQRTEGYLAALDAAGVASDPCWVAMPAQSGSVLSEAEAEGPTHDARVGRAQMSRMLDAGVSAVLCFNDMVAVGALRCCHELGVSVPGQVSIVGYDDIGLAGYLTPSLTTVRQPGAELGHLAARLLLDLLEGRPVLNHVLSPTLVKRESTAALQPS